MLQAFQKQVSTFNRLVGNTQRPAVGQLGHNSDRQVVLSVGNEVPLPSVCIGDENVTEFSTQGSEIQGACGQPGG